MSAVHDKLIRRLEALVCPSLEDSKHYVGTNVNEGPLKGSYKYIPLPTDEFIKQLDIAVGLADDHCHPNQIRFVDVGCGLGTKLFLAKQLHYQLDVFGIEHNPEYIPIAEKIVGKKSRHGGGGRIALGNAFKANFKYYDIIYFYCPMCDHAMQQKLEEHIVRTAKKGAIFMANLKQHPTLWKDQAQVERIWKSIIYRKV